MVEGCWEKDRNKKQTKKQNQNLYLQVRGREDSSIRKKLVSKSKTLKF